MGLIWTWRYLQRPSLVLIWLSHVLGGVLVEVAKVSPRAGAACYQPDCWPFRRALPFVREDHLLVLPVP